MYAQLGNIRFEGLKGFSSFTQNFAVAYAQHARINGKPRLEATGDELDTISFELRLHANFTDPEADVLAFTNAMRNREVMKLILGNGTVVGDFVIPTFEKVTEFTDPSGNIIEAVLSVELLESYNEDLLREAKKQAANAAFATTTRNSNVRSVLPPKEPPGLMVTSHVSQIQASTIQVNQYTEAAAANPSTFEYYSGKINSALDAIEKGITAINDTLSNNEDVNGFSGALPSALQEVYTRVQNMRAVLPITDIDSFRPFSAQLRSSASAARIANTELSNQSVIRRI